MVTKEILNFSLEEIRASGQCFRMEKIEEDRFSLVALGRYLEMEQKGSEVTFFCEQEEFDSFWRNYFDLDADYGGYLRAIDPRDRYLLEAARLGSGIRILRQELWEMIVSFLISQQNHIARIRRCINNICVRYGEERSAGQGLYYTFPSPQALALAPEQELRDCNLGYRAKYVSRAARAVASGEVSLEEIRAMDYPRAKEALLAFYGVGEKVADCICLFALHQTQAFPIDTHIRQALDAHYKKGFPRQKYEGIEGILQQYIFYYELSGGPVSGDRDHKDDFTL